MSYRIQITRERAGRWEVSFPQRHFATETSSGHVYQLNNIFFSFKDAVLYAQNYRKEYSEWSAVPFTYVCNNGGTLELHDLTDDATILEFILRFNE
jgi:hypothetical protein